jgi:hypothetical protein
MTASTLFTLIVSLFLFALAQQTLGSWGLGPLCALLGAFRLRRRPDDPLGKVAWGAMGWSLPVVLMVFGLRAAVAVSGLIVLFNAPHLDWRYDIDLFFSAAGFLAWGAAGVVALWWVAGPWLRAWTNIALGIWASTRARRRSERVWMALVGQLGFGLAGALIWLCVQSTAALAALLVFDGWLLRGTGLYSFPPFSLLAGQAAPVTALVIIVGIGGYLVGQALLSGLYLHRARRRFADAPHLRSGAAGGFAAGGAPGSATAVEHSAG